MPQQPPGTSAVERACLPSWKLCSSVTLSKMRINIVHQGAVTFLQGSYGSASWLIVRPEGNVLVDSPRWHPQLAERIKVCGFFCAGWTYIGCVGCGQAAEVLLEAASAWQTRIRSRLACRHWVA